MKNKIIFGIFILSFVVSIVLSFPNSDLGGLCDVNSDSGCGGVQNSKYGYLLGFNNSYLGLGVFLILSIIMFSHMKKPHKQKKIFIDLGIILGAITSIYFLFLQIFVLKSFCKYCLVIDIGMITALILIIPWGKNN